MFEVPHEMECVDDLGQRRLRAISPPETDLIATYQFDRHVLGYVGYNHFFPGDFVRQTEPSRSSDYLYGALQFTF